jgi:hypothetical protein
MVNNFDIIEAFVDANCELFGSSAVYIDYYKLGADRHHSFRRICHEQQLIIQSIDSHIHYFASKLRTQLRFRGQNCFSNKAKSIKSHAIYRMESAECIKRDFFTLSLVLAKQLTN